MITFDYYCELIFKPVAFSLLHIYFSICLVLDNGGKMLFFQINNTVFKISINF